MKMKKTESVRTVIVPVTTVTEQGIREIIRSELKGVNSKLDKLDHTVKANYASTNTSMMKEFTRQNKRLASIHTDIRIIKEHLDISDDDNKRGGENT